jgi:hypothetical protein
MKAAGGSRLPWALLALTLFPVRARAQLAQPEGTTQNGQVLTQGPVHEGGGPPDIGPRSDYHARAHNQDARPPTTFSQQQRTSFPQRNANVIARPYRDAVRSAPSVRQETAPPRRR